MEEVEEPCVFSRAQGGTLHGVFHLYTKAHSRGEQLVQLIHREETGLELVRPWTVAGITTKHPHFSKPMEPDVCNLAVCPRKGSGPQRQASEKLDDQTPWRSSASETKSLYYLSLWGGEGSAGRGDPGGIEEKEAVFCGMVLWVQVCWVAQDTRDRI
ncbi:hypothetical protein P7K49_033693 [Saguinus oedipus]|uniref:Uncharacterized protein n=1 Tax=Saguinus oedipus TaxID=9490 RepID=A0ABQ9TT18_SAGOE|nr:hypothetical protein P7K49_033693 [Saguinus oedipus]